MLYQQFSNKLWGVSKCTDNNKITIISGGAAKLSLNYLDYQSKVFLMMK
jgi:hypothetical protein